MSCRGKPDDCYSGLRIPEAVERARPIVVAAVAARRIGSSLLTPVDQAWAKPAGVDLASQLLKRQSLGDLKFLGHA